jgi:hypothetical protein
MQVETIKIALLRIETDRRDKIVETVSDCRRCADPTLKRGMNKGTHRGLFQDLIKRSTDVRTKSLDDP